MRTLTQLRPSVAVNALAILALVATQLTALPQLIPHTHLHVAWTLLRLLLEL